jgi:hypothetical protein
MQIPLLVLWNLHSALSIAEGWVWGSSNTTLLQIYGYGLAIVDEPSKADGILLKLGYQPTTGRFLYLLDLDGPNHGPSFDADYYSILLASAHPL